MEAHELTERIHREGSEAAPEAILRRGFDLLAAAALLVLLSPLLLLVALAIRLEGGGPAFFLQRRVGRGQREFTLVKFRSMHPDVDPRRHRDYVASLIRCGENGSRPAERGGLYKLEADDRVSRVGRLIRKWSIDELPQLLNVIAGDMTLVGPRPVIPYEVAEYPGWYRRRFAVKPGLTGLWQVSGRNQRTYEEMVRLDIEYVDTRSALLDLAILARTPWAVASGRGAQ
jgi:lipopolysaccharide/colanic/teichoic acid biosynthesis glycosyltransferase